MGKARQLAASQGSVGVPRPRAAVEINLNGSFELHGGSLGLITGRPSILMGIPFGRPVVGYGGQTMNTLRPASAVAPEYFDFSGIQQSETSLVRSPRFLVAASLADLVGRFRRNHRDWTTLCPKGGGTAQQRTSGDRGCGVDANSVQ
jgi:glycogen phosphorylase